MTWSILSTNSMRRGCWNCWTVGLEFVGGKPPVLLKGHRFFFLSGLSGGFKHFLFSPLPGEMIQFDSYFSDGLKPPASFFLETFRCISGVFPFPQEMGNAFKKKGVFFFGWAGLGPAPNLVAMGKQASIFLWSSLQKKVFVTKKRSFRGNWWRWLVRYSEDFRKIAVILNGVIHNSWVFLSPHLPIYLFSAISTGAIYVTNHSISRSARRRIPPRSPSHPPSFYRLVTNGNHHFFFNQGVGFFISSFLKWSETPFLEKMAATTTSSASSGLEVLGKAALKPWF